MHLSIQKYIFDTTQVPLLLWMLLLLNLSFIFISYEEWAWSSLNIYLIYSQFKEFLGTYNKLTETCFLDCVKDFTSREVKPEEVCDLFYMFWIVTSKKLISARKLQYDEGKIKY